MPHGTPDWGLVGPKTTVYGLDDLGELGVRLGGVVVWDRRGDQVFATDFRHGIGDVELFCDGGSCAAVLHTGGARQGAYCLKLTAGDDGLQRAFMRKTLPYLVTGRVGIEASFGFEADTDYVELYANLRDGGGRWEPLLRLDPNTGDLWVITAPASVAVPVSATADAHLDPSCCNTIKLVVDLTRVFGVYTGYYVRAIVNELEYDISAYPIDYAAGAWVPRAQLEFRHYGDDDKNPVGWMDCFIMTQNEP